MTDHSAAMTHLDHGPEAVVAGQLERCCGSSAWVRGMLQRRPFGNVVQLRAAAERVADSLGREDWLEAIDHHPRIGDRELLRQRVAGWAGGEQGGVDARDEELLDRLEAANAAYEERFGFIFLVCASGLTGRAMLDELTRRLGGDPATEWMVAAHEQRRITQLRITRLLEELGPGVAAMRPTMEDD